MGLSVEQYLARRQACEDCITHGDEDHCETTLLSREDNCLMYNMVWAYHIPNREKHLSFTPDERNRMSAAALAEAQLLQDLRSKLHADNVVDYYIRSQNLVTMIKGVHSNDRSVWAAYYTRFMPIILDHLRNKRYADAMAESWTMVETLEATNGRVICNWLMDNGLFSAKDLAIDTQFSVKYLSDNTKIGYWLWACPLVAHMERKYKSNKNSLMVKTIRILAQSRANEIAYQMGARQNCDALGKVVRLVGESVCYVLGCMTRPFVTEKFKNWLVAYNANKL
jgi:hypothetical protein